MAILAKAVALLIQGLYLTTVYGITVTENENCNANGGPNGYTTPKPYQFLNGTCTTSSDCGIKWVSFNEGSFVCKDGICQCAEDFYPSVYQVVSAAKGQYQVFCAPNQNLPSLNSTCYFTCQKPLQCVEVSPSDYTTPTYTTDIPATRKQCKCVEPYTLNKGQCVLQCKEDEIYTNFACHKKCADNEIQLDNFECKPISALGAACEVDQQCSAAFSECASKLCSCRSGFKADSNMCIPVASYCDFGEPLRAAGAAADAAPVACSRTDRFDGYYAMSQYNGASKTVSVILPLMPPGPGGYPSTSPETNDQLCPANYYCQAIDGPRGSKTNGICCPHPRSKCPVGEPHPTANCSNSLLSYTTPNAPPGASPYGGPGGPGGPNVPGLPGYSQPSNENPCPAQTHFCYDNGIYNGRANFACCPRPCSRKSVLVNGQCLPLVSIGGKCQANEQCSSSYGDCTNGVCVCPPKTRETRRNSMGPGAYGPGGPVPYGPGGPSFSSSNDNQTICLASCDYTEVAINNRCFPRLKIGDSCDIHENRCPSSAQCDYNTRTCQCYCGLMAINGVICARPPTCPSVGRSSSPSPMNNYNYYTTQKPPTKEDFEKATYCRYNGQEPPIPEAVNECPSTHYCRSYIPNLGVCCERPAPFCPYNSNVYDHCEMGSYYTSTPNPNKCKEGQFCHQYFYGNVNTTDAVCCDYPPTRTYSYYQTAKNTPAPPTPVS